MTATRSRRVRRGRVSAERSTVRVAIYTRKSVTEGLEQEFNSLDAQRQAAEKYVESQQDMGWVTLPKRYDDAGFTGANTERPAFQTLLRDIEAGLVDAVAVYKIDRLSRSLRDFAAIVDLFERHKVNFVSVTQQFSTASSVGKLTLNILMSFAEFERGVISERIRDKVQGSRRRGMWTGGRPVLGYDVRAKKLVVNDDEARQVRSIFQLYLELESLRDTVAELAHRGWRNKSFASKSGRWNEGRAFTRATLHALLNSSLYRGQVRCHDETVTGVHEPIVPQGLWDAVQERLQSNSSGGGAKAKNRTGAILRGLVHCGRCGSPMLHTFSSKRQRRHRYYVCRRYRDEGAKRCPKSRVPAGQFERFVADQIKIIGADEVLLARTADSVDKALAARREELTSELRQLEKERPRLAGSEAASPQVTDRIAGVRCELRALEDHDVDADDLRDALASFTPIWDQLFPREQERILRLMIERITYDPDDGDVELHLRPTGIEALADEARAAS